MIAPALDSADLRARPSQDLIDLVNTGVPGTLMAGSGGDLMPYMFRFRKIGPLVGKRTWGVITSYSIHYTKLYEVVGHAEADGRVTHLRVVGHVDEVAAGGELAAAGETEAVHLGDHRLAELPDAHPSLGDVTRPMAVPSRRIV